MKKFLLFSHSFRVRRPRAPKLSGGASFSKGGFLIPYFSFLFLSLPNDLFSQVAINNDGTASTDPTAMLEIKKGIKSKLKVRSLNYTDTAVIELSNRTATGMGTDFIISARREEGLFFTTTSDLVGNINDSLFAMRRNGNIGIGVKFPVAPLHIKSSSAGVHLMIEGLNPNINFFDQNQVRRGYLTYNGDMELGTPTGSGVPVVVAPGQIQVGHFTTTGRFGLGTASPSDLLHVNGNMNLTGVLKINGTSGTTGQVLTSSGSGDPLWKNTSHSNNTRFAVNLETFSSPPGFGTSVGGVVDITGTKYNFDPTNILIGSNNITINKAGLYHFEGVFTTRLYYAVGTVPASIPELATYAFVSGAGSWRQDINVEQAMRRTYIPGSSQQVYVYNGTYSFDVYVTAGAQISFNSRVDYWTNPINTCIHEGQMSGYLISE